MLRSAPNKLRKRPSRPLRPSARLSANSYSSTSTFCEDQDKWVLIPSLPYPSSPRPHEALREFGRKCKRSLSFSRSKDRDPKTIHFGRSLATHNDKDCPRMHSFLELAKEPSMNSEEKIRMTRKQADVKLKSTPDLRESSRSRDSADELLIEVLAQFPCPPQMCRKPVSPGVRGHASNASFSLPTSRAYPEAWRQSRSCYQDALPQRSFSRSRQAGLLLHRIPATSEVPFPSPIAY